MYDPNQNITIREETGRIRVQTLNSGTSLTQQQFKDECDINNIIRKYESTGEFTHTNRRAGIYGDFSDIPDYQEMLHRIQSAQEAFLTLPPTLRLRFKNDPGQLIAFLQDANNRSEAISLGLIPDPLFNSNLQAPNQTTIQTTNNQAPSIPTPPPSIQ